MRAIIPRRGEVDQIIAGFGQRVRRLEVNRTNPRTGTAAYKATYGGAPAAATWTPNFSAATVLNIGPPGADSIGLAIGSSGVTVPPGWLVTATVQFQIMTSIAPPTGEALEWSVAVGSGATDPAVAVARNDVLVNSTTLAQTFGATIIAPASVAGNGLGIYVNNTMKTLLGTAFVPVYMQLSAMGCTLVKGGWSDQ